MIIYKVTNKIDKKSYIGRTKSSLDERKKQHIRASKKETNNVFHKVLKELGEEAFTWEVIHTCGIKESKSLEIYYIGCFDSYNNGYNSIIISNTNKKTNLGKPRCCRLLLEQDDTLVALAGAASISPGMFIHIEMTKVLKKMQSLIVA